MRLVKKLLQSVLFVCAVSSIMPAYGMITIQYEQPTVEGAPDKISKVFFSKGKEERKEIPHVTLAQLVDANRRSILKQKDELFKSWKKFTIGQVGTFAFAAAAFMKSYINDDGVAALKNKPLVRSLLQKASKGEPKLKFVVVSALAALGIYPFIRYHKLFGLRDIEFYYPYEQVNDKIVVFCRKTYSHSVRYGDTIIYYYNVSDPLGYMTLDEKEKEFKAMRQVNRRAHISALNFTLCMGGLLWAALT